jgi:hypothetical protein
MRVSDRKVRRRVRPVNEMRWPAAAAGQGCKAPLRLHGVPANQSAAIGPTRHFIPICQARKLISSDWSSTTFDIGRPPA